MREITKAKILAVNERVKNGETLVDALASEKLGSASYYGSKNKKPHKKAVPKLLTLSDGIDTPIARTQSKVVCIVGTPDDIAEVLRKGMQ